MNLLYGNIFKFIEALNESTSVKRRLNVWLCMKSIDIQPSSLVI